MRTQALRVIYEALNRLRLWGAWFSLLIVVFGLGVVRGRRAAAQAYTLARADQRIAALKARLNVSETLSHQSSREVHARLAAWRTKDDG